MEETTFDSDLEKEETQMGGYRTPEEEVDPGEGTSAGTQEMADFRKTLEDLKKELARAERHRDRSDIRRSNYRGRGPRISRSRRLHLG